MEHFRNDLNIMYSKGQLVKLHLGPDGGTYQVWDHHGNDLFVLRHGDLGIILEDVERDPDHPGEELAWTYWASKEDKGWVPVEILKIQKPV